MAGMQGGLGFSPYGASKFAVVSMSEGLSLQLKPHGIGVSVLCPSYVRTRIGASGRNRPERYGQSQPLDPASPSAAMVAEIARNIDAGLEPDAVAARVLAAIRDDELYIFTHPGMRAEVEQKPVAPLRARAAAERRRSFEHRDRSPLPRQKGRRRQARHRGGQIQKTRWIDDVSAASRHQEHGSRTAVVASMSRMPAPKVAVSCRSHPVLSTTSR